jgi:probable HAF family extracellular repeat protein
LVPAVLVACCIELCLQAATPPAVSLVYTAPANASIHGGVSFGNNGSIFFAALKTPTSPPRIIGLNSQHLALWQTPWDAPPDADIYAPPAVSLDGSRLYFGADDGVVYCLLTATGAKPTEWQNFSVTGSATNRRIRAGVALDGNGPLGTVAYVHANNGFLYALNAVTGFLYWSAPTGNAGGPSPVTGKHDQTVSSSPVVDASGTVYVGSADGGLYAFNPASGILLWRVPLNDPNTLGDPDEPVEATASLDERGFVYVGTRQTAGTGSGGGGAVYCINPSASAPSNPQQRIVWRYSTGDTSVGCLTSPIIDQSGYVYAAAWGLHSVVRLHPDTGSIVGSWGISGKLCQTPSINQNGLLIVGESKYEPTEVDAITGIDTASPSGSAAWSVTSVGGSPLANFVGSPAIRCDSTGNAYLADMQGRLYRFASGAPLMAGDWPTLSAGNRRRSDINSHPYLIAELPNFYGGTSVGSALDVNRFGHVVGQAHGYYRYPYGGEFGFAAAVWKNVALTGYGGYYGSGGSIAHAINALGDAVGNFYSNGPCFWAADSGGFVYLGVPTGYSASSSYAADINDAGIAIGYGFKSGQTWVIRWVPEDGVPYAWAKDPVSPPAGGVAYAYALSNGGRVAGKAKFEAGGSFRAYVTDPAPSSIDSFADIGTLGGFQSEAWDVHDESGAVGWAQTPAGKRRAFYLQTGAGSLQPFDELPRLAGTSGMAYQSEAYGVNRYGQVVGKVQNDAGAWKAFLFNPGSSSQLVDLNGVLLGTGLTPAVLGWNLTQANAINDGGVITGTGFKNGVAKLWILYRECQE